MKNVIVLFSLLVTLNIRAADSECIVISGLEKDESNAFWSFKDQNLYKGCTIYKSIKEFSKTGPKDKVIDLRVISHGKEDGTLRCDAGDETPAEVINTLNSIGENNKIFVSLDSCYSEQVLKEKVLQDHKNLSSSKAQNNLCLYASSAPMRKTYVDQVSFADLQFMGKEAPKNISVLELYNQTEVGLLSAAPYDESGITSFWANEDVKTAIAPFLETLEKFMNSSSTLPIEKCQTLVLVNKLSPTQFAELSGSIIKMGHSESTLQFTDERWKELILSFDRLTKREETKEYFQAWLKNGPDYGVYRDVIRQCEAQAQEPFCKNVMQGLSSAVTDFIFEHRKLVALLENVSGKKIALDEITTSKELLKHFSLEVGNTKNQMTADSYKAIMGVPSTVPALEFSVSAPESQMINWSGYLGAFNRLSLAPGNIENWSGEKDKTRYNACKQFYYDGEGKLRSGPFIRPTHEDDGGTTRPNTSANSKQPE